MSLVAKFKKQDRLDLLKILIETTNPRELGRMLMNAYASDDMEALFSVMEFSIKEHLLEKLSPSKTAMKKEAKAQALAKAKA